MPAARAPASCSAPCWRSRPDIRFRAEDVPCALAAGSNDSVHTLDRDEVSALRTLKASSMSPYAFTSERGGRSTHGQEDPEACPFPHLLGHAQSRVAACEAVQHLLAAAGSSPAATARQGLVSLHVIPRIRDGLLCLTATDWHHRRKARRHCSHRSHRTAEKKMVFVHHGNSMEASRGSAASSGNAFRTV